MDQDLGKRLDTLESKNKEQGDAFVLCPFLASPVLPRFTFYSSATLRALSSRIILSVDCPSHDATKRHPCPLRLLFSAT